MLKRGLVIGIMVLLLGMTFVPLAGSLSVEKGVSADMHITTPPEVEVTWEVYKVDGKWYVDFICDSAEEMDDIDRVEMYIDDAIHEMITGPGPVYIFTIEWSKAMKSCIFKFVFYGLGGDTAVVIIDGSDIKSHSSSQNVMSITPSIENALFFEDTTPPVIEITWEVEYVLFKGWYVTINVNCYDEESGIDLVHIFLNDVLHETIIGPGPVYETTYEFKWSPFLKNAVLKVIAWDGAGNSATESLYFSDITPHPHSQQHSNPVFLQILQRVVNYGN